MSIENILDRLRLDPRFFKHISAWERIPARPAQYATPPENLHPQLGKLLERTGYSPLYTHQAEAIEASLNRENVVLVTGTASGKSLAYHLVALQSLIQDPDGSVLYIFPTKALAQDQAASLNSLLEKLEIPRKPAVNLYDGDTPSDRRAKVRQMGGIIITNPDMLHVGMLPYHTRWEKVFSRLKVVVLDEIHTYRGAFGSHMANVIRRLKRICHFYGSDPRFICTSATIANPQEHAEKLIEGRVTLVSHDGSQQGERHIVIYNPPEIDPESGMRRSHILEVRAIASALLAGGAQTIVFAVSRLKTEILLGYIKEDWMLNGGKPDEVRGYRGGYLPNERRQIEHGLREGVIRGVVATNALELGVDIGALEAAVIAGYPGTIASTWQQFGRAGRRAGVSLGVLVASGMPLDQYLAKHPAFILEGSPEHALINPDNLKIFVNHLRCAAYELPFEIGEGFGPLASIADLMQVLEEQGEIHTGPDLYRWMSPEYPASEFSLRTSSNAPVVIQSVTSEGPRVIGEVDRASAPSLVYEGAVYLHEGEMYLIEELDWEGGKARARQVELDYYTVAQPSSSLRVLEEYENVVAGDCLKSTGRVNITTQMEGYKLVKRYTHELLGFGEVHLPPREYDTTAYWLSLTPDLTASLEAKQILLRPNDYGPNWKQQRDRARERDGFRCQICGMPETPIRQHDVHHIRPFREFNFIPEKNDHYLSANQIDNLMTLCSVCHHRIENQDRTRGALSGFRNVLHNLATLYLMCAPTDIEVVAEVRSPYTRTPTITVYDRAEEGLGFSMRLFELHDEILRAALRVVEACGCQDGCPACVGPAENHGEETKALTIDFIKALLA